MKRFYKSVGFLFFAFAGMTASALNIEVASGYAERRQIGEFEVLFVKSNSTLRISGKSGVIDVLAVGGGGGGATCFGGGGGGGAVVERHDVAVMPGDYEITIGAGGINGSEFYGVFTEAGKGGDTSAFGITAPGGGAGGLWGWADELNVGATGGGAGAIGDNDIVAKNGLYRGGEYFSIAGAPGTAGFGYGGGACTNIPHVWTSFGGGGGGAGGPGGDARGCSVAGGTDGMAGAGGIGVCSILTGEPLWYGGGGGGGANRCIGRAEGGKGGGGRGSVGFGREVENLPEAGRDFTGGGGGGGSSVNGNAFYPGGAGGCGIVIVRYRRKDASPVRAVEVVGDGLVERKIYGGYECLIVKSNAVLHVNGSQQVDVLAVGGGGGGATLYGGGGGGGGVVERYGLSVPAGDYLAVVGQGGAGGFEDHGFKEAEAGGLSSIFGVEALGGGAGGLMGWGEQSVGASGGGAGALGPGESYISKDGLHRGGEIFSISGAPGIDGLGFHGGACTNLNNRFYSYGGGGGGAGGPGQDAVYNGDPYLSMAGAGGAGRSSSITGELVYYGGGGGGGACRAKERAAGGIGGGGSGSQENGTGEGENGTDFCGGGGGGARSLAVGNGSRGGRGGSGLIVVRYRYNAQITSTVHEEGIANGGDVYRRFRGFGIHMFSKDGTFSLYEPATVDLLLVGGGGGGGGNRGGGGGGGGVAIMTNVVLQAGTYEVMVGEGGVGEPRGKAHSSRAPATNGGSSSITNAFGFSVSVLGGGAGGNGGWASGVSNAGKDGACGGGGGMPGYWTVGNSSLGGKGVPYQGCDGGCSVNGSDTFRTFGGGGGGAGKRGEDAVYGLELSTYGAGKGGDGLCCDFSGKSLYYGGGGGGGNGGRPVAGVCVAGGVGGGGAGGFGDRLTDEGISYSDGADGVAGTGGGGGGGGGHIEDGGAGGHGGSGVVIIRYHLKKGGVCIVVR